MQFTNLYLVAQADGKVNRAETKMLDAFARKMGITPQQIKDVQREANYLTFYVPKTMKERLAHLEALIQLMTIDGEIHDREYQLCLNYANRSGCDQLVLDMLIEKVLEGKR
ncbi:hypothetical protein BKI52_05405 [marine bacterium AO1-C]|nr:hypothetical protein BKI52_05405 [marine bacterium AO1-C]